MQDPNTIHTVTLTGHDLTLEQLVAVCRCRACGTGRNEKAVRSPEPDRFPFRAARRYMRPLSSEAPASTDFFRKALPDLKLQVIPI